MTREKVVVMARILVIDDDAGVRRVVARLLEMEGHTVVQAENGKVALEQYAHEPTDLVISDIYMPEMDGIELLTRLRESFPDARLVAMSGGGAIAAHHMLKAAEALGAVGVVEKPFDLDAIRVHLDGLEPNEVSS